MKDIISGIVAKHLKYSVPRLGKVLNIQDEDQTGKILVSIPAFNWTTQSKGQWCYPKDKNKLVTPKLDGYVIVEWMDGEPDGIAVYSGIAYWMKDMLPDNYDGQPTTQILFEDNKQEAYIKYDELTKNFTINIKDFIFEIDTQGKIYKLDDGSNKIEMDSNVGKITLDDGSNKIEMDNVANKIDLTGTFLNIFAASESYIKGDTLCNALTTLCSTIATATSGNAAQNAAGIVTIKAAFATFSALITSFKSLKIKGE